MVQEIQEGGYRRSRSDGRKAAPRSFGLPQTETGRFGVQRMCSGVCIARAVADGQVLDDDKAGWAAEHKAKRRAYLGLNLADTRRQNVGNKTAGHKENEARGV